MNVREKIELLSINETYCRRHGLKMIFSVLVTDGELSIALSIDYCSFFPADSW
jgi:hypothetical protein